MSDDLTKKVADSKRIAIKQVWERQHWCKAFGITKASLEAAVKEVGPMVKDVRAFLIEKIRNAT